MSGRDDLSEDNLNQHNQGKSEKRIAREFVAALSDRRATFMPQMTIRGRGAVHFVPESM